MISTIIMRISLGSIILGALLGLLRGANRSVLRLVLIIACAIASFFLMNYLTNMILSFELEGGVTIRESILANFGDASEIPESLINLIITLVEIIFGLALFFFCFVLLTFLSWMIIFPIFKIFIKPGKNRHTLVGMGVGALQGVLVAFLLCVPLNGLASEISKLSNVEINGQKIPIPEQIELSGYNDSATYKFYNGAGGWFYELLTTKESETGTDVSVSDTIDVVVVTTNVVKETTNLATNLNKVSDSETTVQEKVSSLKDVGDNLINISTNIDSLSDGGKEILKEVITDVVSSFVSGGEEGGEETGSEEGGSEEVLPPAVQEVIENLDFDDFSLESTGEAIKGISSYIEKTADESFENYGEEVTQEEVESIVNGVADNSFIIDVITGGAETPEEVPTLIEVKEEDAEKFESAITQADKLSEDQKEMLKKLLGLA